MVDILTFYASRLVATENSALVLFVFYVTPVNSGQ
jgi:hypothetical protein